MLARVSFFPRTTSRLVLRPIVIDDWQALYFTGVPVVVAAIAGGLPSALWATVVLLTAFPGVPLIAAGIYVRSWLARKDPAYVDPWLI